MNGDDSRRRHKDDDKKSRKRDEEVSMVISPFISVVHISHPNCYEALIMIGPVYWKHNPVQTAVKTQYIFLKLQLLEKFLG